MAGKHDYITVTTCDNFPIFLYPYLVIHWAESFLQTSACLQDMMCVLNIYICIVQPEVIAKSLEKFISMSIRHIEIKDSLNFMSLSLDKLVRNLKEKG